jgi:hypothetical protein
MKSLFYMVISAFLLVSCSKNDDGNNNNPNIPNFAFDTGQLINTSLPQYNHLTLPGNSISLYSQGVNGVVLYYAGNNNYSAFELSDPNHQLQTCSVLTVSGVFATCGCQEEGTYEILNGLPVEGTVGEYPLKRYFVEVNGSIIRVYNN